MTIYGSGKQTRSFCYVTDLVDGLVRLMNTPEIHEPVNLGNPAEITMLHLARAIASICGLDPNVAYCPLPADDPQQRRPDITRARRLLDWMPTTPLRLGLSKMVAHTVQREKEKQTHAG
jgi:UDP-glucuronate decarboxylase